MAKIVIKTLKVRIYYESQLRRLPEIRGIDITYITSIDLKIFTGNYVSLKL